MVREYVESYKDTYVDKFYTKIFPLWVLWILIVYFKLIFNLYKYLRIFCLPAYTFEYNFWPTYLKCSHGVFLFLPICSYVCVQYNYYFGLLKIYLGCKIVTQIQNAKLYTILYTVFYNYVSILHACV